jgi:hypothetical protein
VLNENLERARLGYDAWSRGDLEGLLATLDEEIEFLRIVIDHFRERGDQIVALYRFEAVGRDGLAVQRQAAKVITLRNGLPIRLDAHGSWKTALEAASLQP